MNSNDTPIRDIESQPATKLYLHEWTCEEDKPIEGAERFWRFVHPDGTRIELMTVDGEVSYWLPLYEDMA